MPASVFMFGLLLYFWKPAFVDQRVGFFLHGSSGPTRTSPGARPAREGSLLRRTWRGMSAEYKKGGKKKGRVVNKKNRGHRVTATSNHLLVYQLIEQITFMQ